MKSNVSSLLELAECIYRDATAGCIADVSDLRDLETLRSRVEHGGDSFLTITLPQFAKDFERSLADQAISPTAFQYFRKAGSIPAFLQGMIGLVFNRETGVYDPTYDVSITADLVDRIRQVCLAFKKIELPCTSERNYKAIENFVEVERSFETFTLQEDVKEYQYYLDVCSVLWGGSFDRFSVDAIHPKHGPGATADSRTGNAKYEWRWWYERLDPYFPLLDSAYSCSAIDSEEVKRVTLIPEDWELPVKVTLVPKTLKGPRLIAIEPCCMQYAQQGIREYLYGVLESHPVAGGRINFRDQWFNQELALIGSKLGSIVTIDLSDASDRVPRELALDMFLSNPDLLDCIEACRSTHANLPSEYGGSRLGPLRKFASMGSALCFPVESMYFYTLCVMALLRARKLRLTWSNVRDVGSSVFVYGDDIVVPRIHAKIILEHLQKYNCKVNENKTFLEGNFRESCGLDAFSGYEVTPTYIGTRLPKDKQDSAELVSTVATANAFYRKGYWVTADYLFQRVEKILGPLPFVSDDSPALGRHSFQQKRSFQRWNNHLQAFEVKAWVAEPVYRTDVLDGYGALQKSLSKLEVLQDLWDARDPKHLERTARHGVVTLKRRWV